MAGRGWLAVGAVLAGISVAMGAYSAHGLKTKAQHGDIAMDRWEDCESAVRQQMPHAIGIMFAGLLMQRSGRRCIATAAAICFLIGILLFCGGLYGYALGGERDWMRAAPWGGTTMIVGWFLLALSAWRGCASAPPSNMEADWAQAHR